MSSETQLLKNLLIFCRDVMQCDRYSLQRRIRDLQIQLKTKRSLTTDVLTLLIADVEASLKRRQGRAENLPTPSFPDELPICTRRDDIAAAIQQHSVVIVAGETGSGKTTQLPKICLNLKRGIAGMIACTQPRRIAARTIAQRVAAELNSPLGQWVGYKVRFSDHTHPTAYIKFMTDGILLAEIQGDKFLNAYDTLIIDEAHERSLNIDFLIGYVKQLLPKRPDLKVIITSATIDTQRFSQHFREAPVIQVSGRTYPVEVRYRPLAEEEEERNLQQAVVDAIDEITAHDRQADTLVFLSGERDIRETAERLRKHRLPNTEILPLYARLSTAEQNRVFTPTTNRRIVLATNVAETSLTVPRIKAVVDTGLARISRYSVRSKVQHLLIESIARSSADQRKGRCGRVAPGICIRLYSENDYQQRPEFTDPEILRTSLAAVILQMVYLRLGDINDFPFLDPPETKMINDGFTLLTELGAVNERRQLTPIGQQLAKLPIDPRIGRMILAAKELHCLKEVLIIGSALSIQDPRERPLEAQQAADTAQQRFNDENSDFMSFLKLRQFFQENSRHLSKNKLRQLCHDHFLSYLRMREWEDIHQQLYTLVRELGWTVNEVEASYEQIHRALLTGLLGNVAFKTEVAPDIKKVTRKTAETEQYVGTRNVKLFLFPGSGLYKKPPKWLMAAELVETSRLFARCVAKIQPEWIEEIAGHLCHRHYFEPHWEKRVAEVAGFEKVTLYGLTIVAKRKINYGPLDPKGAREIFIRHALVEGDYYTTASFFRHNQQLINEIKILEHKARRQDILIDEDRLYDFYAERIPEGIYSGKTFEQWRKQVEREQPKLLFLTHEILMNHAGENVTKDSFPDALRINGIKLPLSYHFEPGHARDGVTVNIPLALLNQLSPYPFEWLVPGLLEEKIIALLRELPKPLRKLFVPVPDVARDAYRTLINAISLINLYETESDSARKTQKDVRLDKKLSEVTTTEIQSLYVALSAFLQQRCGTNISPTVWNKEDFSPYLLMNFCLLDANDHILDMNRSLEQLQQTWGSHATTVCQQKVVESSGLERDHLTSWDFGELPESISLKINGVTVQGFPTLVDENTHVALRIFDQADKAKQAFYAGLRRLFWLALPNKNLLKQLPVSSKLSLQYVRLGNSDTLRQDILLAVIGVVFLHEPLPKSSSAFEQRLMAGKPKLLETANGYAEHLSKVLAEYTALRQQFHSIPSQHGATLADVEQQLSHLVYPGFIPKTPLAQLKHLPRYLKAIQLRLDKLQRDPCKDIVKIQQISPFWQAYLDRQVKQHQISDKLSEFRWMLEEFRVSLFAQELKTAYPISIQRLQKLWSETSE